MSKSKCFLILPRSVFPCVGGYAMTHRRLIEILDRHYRLSLIVLSDHAATNEENAFYQQISVFSIFPDGVIISMLLYLCSAADHCKSGIILSIGFDVRLHVWLPIARLPSADSSGPWTISIGPQNDLSWSLIW